MKKLINSCRGYFLAFLALFNKKKRTTAVLSTSYTPITEPAKVEVQRQTHMPALGRVRDITAMLDAEAVELYGRSPYVK